MRPCFRSSSLVPAGFVVDHLDSDADRIGLVVRSGAAVATCPDCGTPSRRIQSRYRRRAADLPLGGRRVELRVVVRRFWCGAGACGRKIFAERFPDDVLPAFARRTSRLEQIVHHLGLALGGRPGASLAQRLRLPVSRDTLLRVIRRRATTRSDPLGVIGIDDFAWRRNHRYGTLVCDLERRRIVALLPDREQATAQTWLKENASIQIVARDRGGGYGEAIARALPQAIQVAVHIWHLLVNASEALRGVVERHQLEIRSVAHRAVKDPSASPGLRETAPKPEVTSRRRDRCEAALCLHGEGLPTKEIARCLGASCNAVRRWVRAGRFVPYRRAPGSSRLDRYLPFVEARWQEGQHSATALYQELHAQGFTGGYDIVRRWAARRKRGAPARPPSTRIPSTRRITQWLTGDLAALSPEDRAFTEALCSAAPKLSQAAEVVRAFADLLRQNDPTGLTPWLEAAAATNLGGFVTGLRQDEAAVRAAIVEPWSNGLVEGQVNRLKPIKRSMYGRAGFDLLRQRVLHAA